MRESCEVIYEDISYIGLGWLRGLMPEFGNTVLNLCFLVSVL